MSRPVRFASIGLSAGAHAAAIAGMLVSFDPEPPPPPPALLEMAMPMPTPAGAPPSSADPAAEPVSTVSESIKTADTAEPPPPDVAPPPPDAIVAEKPLDPVEPPPPDAVKATEPVETAKTPEPTEPVAKDIPQEIVETVEPVTAEVPPEDIITVDAADAPPPPVAKPPVQAKPKPPPPPRQVTARADTAEKPKKVVQTAPASAPPAPANPNPPNPGMTSVPAERSAPSGPPPDYLQRLAMWLERHKEYPRRAQLRRQEGTVMLRFTIDRDGNVLSHRIVRSSGHSALDDEVEAMIQRAQPLPAIPASLAGAQLEVVVPVQFVLR